MSESKSHFKSDEGGSKGAPRASVVRSLMDLRDAEGVGLESDILNQGTRFARIEHRHWKIQKTF